MSRCQPLALIGTEKSITNAMGSDANVTVVQSEQKLKIHDKKNMNINAI